MPIRKTHLTLAEDALERAIAENKPGMLMPPDIEARGFWDHADRTFASSAVTAAEAAGDLPWPLLTASDYLAFTRTGDRAAFEKKYFFRRRRLSALVLGTCFRNDAGAFLDSAVDGIGLLLDEAGWCLPPHNTKVRDQTPEPLPDPDFPVLDLFAAETGALLGLSGALLRPALDRISPYIIRRIRKEIRERITDPYLHTHFWWMGDGKSQMLNWTPWITQNVLLSVFTGEDHTEEEAGQILRQAARSLDYFLDEYGDDGCCCEGAQYYRHAGLCLFGSLELIDLILPGSMEAVFGAPLVRNMADYIRVVHAAGPWYINYADCSPMAGHRDAREYLFGRRTGNAALSHFAAEDYRDNVWFGTGKEKTGEEIREAVKKALDTEHDEGRLLLSEPNLFYHLLQISAHGQMLQEADRKSEIPRKDVWYASTGLLVAGDDRTVLAAKAGGNGDAHNHNDTGSVTVFRDGRPYLIDLGVETYTAKTFSRDRYTIWTMRSSYHNVMTFCDGDSPVEEKAGSEFAAADTVCRITDQSSSLSMELAPVFDDRRIRSVRRQVTLHRNAAVFGSICDTVDADLPCVLTLLTYEKPVLSGSSIRIGDLGSIRAEGAGRIQIETLPIEDERLQTAWKHDCYRILIPFAGKRLEVFLS